MLQEADVPRHERRGGEAEDLPEGEVPGHDGEHRPERQEADERARRARLHLLVGEEALAVLGVEAADPGALLGLGDGRPEGLAHLEGHDPTPVLLAALEHVPGAGEQGGALGEWAPAPGAEGRRRTGEPGVELGVRDLVEAPERLAGRGVHRGAT